jgi:hypothetical protein
MTVLMQKRGPGGGQGGGSGGGGQGGGGRGGGGRGGGPGGFCICQACGHREPHQQGAPCIEKKCPQCGGVLIRER